MILGASAVPMVTLKICRSRLLMRVRNLWLKPPVQVFLIRMKCTIWRVLRQKLWLTKDSKIIGWH